MTAGIVVAIMITPIITAITREVFATTPASQKEAALVIAPVEYKNPLVVRVTEPPAPPAPAAMAVEPPDVLMLP